MSTKNLGRVVGPTGPRGETGIGIPTGGATNQVMIKRSAADYDVTWADQSGGVTSFNGRTGSISPETGDYTAKMVGALPSTTYIPTKVSDLTNDSDYASKSYVDSQVAGVATSDAVQSLETRMGAAESDIDALENKVGNTAVSSQISSAITALDLANTYDAKGAAEQALSDAKTYAKSYADGKDSAISAAQTAANTAQSGVNALDTRVTSAETSITSLISRTGTVESNITSLTGMVSANENAITTLNGDATVPGSVARYAADVINEIFDNIDRYTSDAVKGIVSCRLATADGNAISSTDGHELAAWRSLSQYHRASDETLTAVYNAIDAHRRDYLATAKALETALATSEAISA